MASPQLENGFIKLATEIVQAISRTNWSSYEIRIIMAIFEKTYGWHKPEDWISNSQFVAITGIEKSHVCRTIKKLIKRNIIVKKNNKIRFQKDYEKWDKLPNQATDSVASIGTPVASIGNKSPRLKLPNQAPTKDNVIYYTKDNDFSFYKENELPTFKDYKDYVWFSSRQRIKQGGNWFMGMKIVNVNGTKKCIPPDRKGDWPKYSDLKKMGLNEVKKYILKHITIKN